MPPPVISKTFSQQDLRTWVIAIYVVNQQAFFVVGTQSA